MTKFVSLLLGGGFWWGVLSTYSSLHLALMIAVAVIGWAMAVCADAFVVAADRACLEALGAEAVDTPADEGERKLPIRGLVVSGLCVALIPLPVAALVVLAAGITGNVYGYRRFTQASQALGDCEY